jgi:hypothetical protein
MNRLLESLHPLWLVALAAGLLWLTWLLGSRPEPVGEMSRSRATGPSIDRAITILGQDPTDAIER